MATPALIFREDGSFEPTPELKLALHLKPGARLELVENTGSEFSFRVPKALKPIHSWQDLEGILADSASDPNEDRRQERRRELESERNLR
jgi:hypothetical protein